MHMGVRFTVADLGRVGLIKPEQVGYQDSIEIIKDESFHIQRSFVKIGWYLKHIRDHELYKEGGYNNIYECAADQFGYSQPTASRFINICEKFSKDHNSPELDIKYAGFDKSQMIEMLPMAPEQLEKVTPDMTVKQIRNIKVKKKDLNTESMVEDDNIPGQTSIENDFPEYMPETGRNTQDKSEPEDKEYAAPHKIDFFDKPEGFVSEDEAIDGEYRETRDSEAEKQTVTDRINNVIRRLETLQGMAGWDLPTLQGCLEIIKEEMATDWQER